MGMEQNSWFCIEKVRVYSPYCEAKSYGIASQTGFCMKGPQGARSKCFKGGDGPSVELLIYVTAVFFSV